MNLKRREFKVEFKKYPSITNSYQQEFLEKISIYHSQEEWFVQEKVHGANFAIYSDGNELRVASRNGFIDENEEFYSHKAILDKYGVFIVALAGCHGETIIYGEICGGHYDGKREGKMVQRGVQYCPHNEFLVFDIVINDEFIPFREVIKLALKHNLRLCPVLARGTLSECLQYSNEFTTTVPDMFGLAHIDGNICEGIVIRPDRFIPWGESRVILKNKNTKFSEKDEKPIKITQIFPEELRSALDEITPYININRVNAVASKIGDCTIKDFQKLIGLTIQDAIEEAGDCQFKKLEPVYRKIISKEVTALTVPIVKKFFGIPC